MHDLEYMSERDITDEVSPSMASSSITFFPSLMFLSLLSCPNLNGWWKRHIFDNGDVGTTSTYQQHISLPSFTRLYELGISYCSKLTCMPLFPTLVELSLNDASLKPLQQTMAMTMNTAGASSLPFSSPPLSKLKNLYLSKVQGVESLPKEWLQNLPSLEKLDISELPTLTFINRTMQRLISHKKLKISD